MKFKTASEKSNHFYMRMITNSLSKIEHFMLKQVTDLGNSWASQGTESLAASCKV